MYQPPAGGPGGFAGVRRFSDIPDVDEPDAPSSAASQPRATNRLLIGAIAVAALGGALAATTYRSFDLDRFFLPKELALDVGAGVAALNLVGGRRAREWTLADLLLAGWLALSLLSATGATNAWHAFRALGITFGGAVMFWSAAALRGAGQVRSVAVFLAVAATAASASALAQAYGADWTIFSANRAPGGMLGNRNFVAHAAAMSIPLLVWLAGTSRSAGGIALGVVGLLANTAVLVLSRTRAAWLAVAVWIGVMALVAWRSRDVTRAAIVPRRGRVVIAALLAGIVLALMIPNTLDWNMDSVRGVVNYREGSGAGRVRQYITSLKLAKAHPVLGVGPGNWPVEYPAVASRNDPSLSDATAMTSNPWPSSDWVAAVSERGVLATLVLAALMVTLLVCAWRGWRDAVYPSRERLAALAGGSVVFIAAIEGMFDAVSLLSFASTFIWAAAGALIPLGNRVWRGDLAGRGRAYLMGATALIWLGFVTVTAGKIHAMRLYSTGTLTGVRAAAAFDPGSYRIQLRATELLAARGMCEPARRSAAAAQRLFPHASGPQAALGRCGGSAR